jgi:hypothetical protein
LTDYSSEVLVTDVVGDMASAVGYERFTDRLRAASRVSHGALDPHRSA